MLLVFLGCRVQRDVIRGGGARRHRQRQRGGERLCIQHVRHTVAATYVERVVVDQQRATVGRDRHGDRIGEGERRLDPGGFAAPEPAIHEPARDRTDRRAERATLAITDREVQTLDVGRELFLERERDDLDELGTAAQWQLRLCKAHFGTRQQQHDAPILRLRQCVGDRPVYTGPERAPFESTMSHDAGASSAARRRITSNSDIEPRDYSVPMLRRIGLHGAATIGVSAAATLQETVQGEFRGANRNPDRCAEVVARICDALLECCLLRAVFDGIQVVRSSSGSTGRHGAWPGLPD
jgi:hypothetical protein